VLGPKRKLAEPTEIRYSGFGVGAGLVTVGSLGVLVNVGTEVGVLVAVCVEVAEGSVVGVGEEMPLLVFVF
jgi:hypothetical protein